MKFEIMSQSASMADISCPIWNAIKSPAESSERLLAMPFINVCLKYFQQISYSIQIHTGFSNLNVWAKWLTQSQVLPWPVFPIINYADAENEFDIKIKFPAISEGHKTNAGVICWKRNESKKGGDEVKPGQWIIDGEFLHGIWSTFKNHLLVSPPLKLGQPQTVVV